MAKPLDIVGMRVLADVQCRVYSLRSLHLQVAVTALAGLALPVSGAVASETAAVLGQGVSAPAEAAAPGAATATAPGAALPAVTTAAVDVPLAAVPSAAAAAAELPAYSAAMQGLLSRMPATASDAVRACMKEPSFKADVARFLRLQGASDDMLYTRPHWAWLTEA